MGADSFLFKLHRKLVSLRSSVHLLPRIAEQSLSIQNTYPAQAEGCLADLHDILAAAGPDAEPVLAKVRDTLRAINDGRTQERIKAAMDAADRIPPDVLDRLRDLHAVTGDLTGRIIDHLAGLSDLLDTPGTRIDELLLHLYNGLHQDAGEQTKFSSAEMLASAIYPKYKFTDIGKIYFEDCDFLKYYIKFMDVGNWHSLDRKYNLNQLLGLVYNKNGDLAECGTYKGASAYLMCAFAKGTARKIHLFDSFEGLSQPNSCDGSHWKKGVFTIQESIVYNMLSDFDNYVVYKGWIPDRFSDVADRIFSFLHIDVDLYEPTLDSLNFFYDRMEVGGIILFDDYGHSTCPGHKKAADEFFSTKPEKIVALSSAQAFVIKM